MSRIRVPMVLDCWNTIGVKGDSSCGELPAVIHCRNCPVFATAGQNLYERIPPPSYIDEWSERISAAELPAPGRTIPVVVFRVGGEWLALDVGLTVEVAPVRAIRRVPHQTDPVFVGLVNIRGELQLAVSLTHLIGAADDPKAESDPAARRLIVAEKDGGRWVFLADQVDDIHHFTDLELGKLPSTVAAGTAVFTRGVFRHAGRSVGYLDPVRVFAGLKRSFR